MKPRIWSIIVAAVTSLAVLLAVFILPGFLGNGGARDASASANNPSPTVSANADPDLVQCRVDAVLAYMKTQGFEDGDYVIGEENVDPEASELLETGSLAFGQNGKNVVTREDLQEVFESEDPALRKVVDAQLAKFPSMSEETVLDSQNWEIVQMTVPTYIAGNTGLVGGQVVSMGTRESATGDGAWLFIDTEACVVAVAEVQPATAQPGDSPAVGLIRVGCINPGDNLIPPPPPPCTIDKPCKDSPSTDPNAPDGGGPNADPGSGDYTPPLEQPPATPRVDPTPAPPAPGPGPTPDPEPAPDPEPEAPTPDDPVNPDEGNGCAPGLPSC
jgi:hypothetical protein